VHVVGVDDAEVVAEVALVDVCNHSDVGSVVRKLELSASIMEYLLSNKIKFITDDYLQAYINITTNACGEKGSFLSFIYKFGRVAYRCC